MRVATSTLYRGIERNILRLSSDLNKTEEKVSSGKNFNRPSDDPVAMVNSLGLSNTLARIEQYQKNMDTAKGWLDINETVLDQAFQLASSAQEIALQLSSGSASAEVRTEAASHIDALINQAVGLGNTQLNGKYIFGGYKTAAPPFARSVGTGPETVNYSGDANDFKVQIGPNQTIAAGKNGGTLFVGANLFDSLIRLKQAIGANDQAAIQLESETLQGTTDYFNAQVSDVGIRQNHLKSQGEIFSQVSLDLKNQLGDLENVDYNKAILEMQQKQTAYNVALSTAAQISKVSLLDYL
jgi:flagellar hook-associated protein 3 FlgL